MESLIKKEENPEEDAKKSPCDTCPGFPDCGCDCCEHTIPCTGCAQCPAPCQCNGCNCKGC